MRAKITHSIFGTQHKYTNSRPNGWQRHSVTRTALFLHLNLHKELDLCLLGMLGIERKSKL